MKSLLVFMTLLFVGSLSNAAECVFPGDLAKAYSIQIMSPRETGQVQYAVEASAKRNSYAFVARKNDTAKALVNMYGPGGFSCSKNYDSAVFYMYLPFTTYNDANQTGMVKGVESCGQFYGSHTSGGSSIAVRVQNSLTGIVAVSFTSTAVEISMSMPFTADVLRVSCF